MKVAKTSKMLLRHQQGYQSHQDNQQHTKLRNQSERNISPQFDITPGVINKRGIVGLWLSNNQNPQIPHFILTVARMMMEIMTWTRKKRRTCEHVHLATEDRQITLHIQLQWTDSYLRAMGELTTSQQWNQYLCYT